MATTYDNNMDPSFINELPTEIVSSFLVRKGVVMNANEAANLYKLTNITTQGHTKLKRINKADFMKIFCRYMFIDALLKVTKQIQKATS